MGITTTYECDKCGHEQDTDEQMWGIGIVVTYPGKPGNYFSREHKLWCRKCAEELGQLKRLPERKDKPVPELTFEDKLREIIREEIEND